MSKFKTWIEGVPLIEIDAAALPPVAAYAEPFDVPEPVRAKIREAFAADVPASELARIFHMPLSWIALFLADETQLKQ